MELNGPLLFVAWFGTLVVPPLVAASFWKVAHHQVRHWAMHILFVPSVVGSTVALTQIMFFAGGNGLAMGMLLVPSTAVLLLTVAIYLLRLSLEVLRRRRLRTDGS